MDFISPGLGEICAKYSKMLHRVNVREHMCLVVGAGELGFLGSPKKSLSASP